MTEQNMKAIRVHQFGGPEVLQVETVPVPVAAPGELLIRIEAVAVNYADVLRRRNGPYPHPTHLPATLGIEVAGTVAAIGEGVTGWEIGQSVFSVLPGALGGYAQYATTAAAGAIPVPPGLSPEVACTLVVAGVTAFQMLRDVGRLQPGQDVFIPAAAGGVGSYALQIAKLLGAGRIIAAASTPERRQEAVRLGATHTVASERDDWSQDILAITESKGVDLALEMVGGAFFDQALASLASFGHLIIYGQVGEEPARLDALRLHDRNQTISGYYVGGRFAGRTAEAVEALKALIGHVLAGEIDVQIGHTFTLDQAPEAHRLVESRQSKGKIVLKPWA